VKLLVATTNAGKAGEYRLLFQGIGADVVGLRDLPLDLDVSESGATFEENARLKARAYAQATNLWTLADDSGLCVDALDGAPGVFSARYGPTDQARIERLLGEMQPVPEEKRTARFVCVIALAEPGGSTHAFEGVCEGRIARQPSGSHGFGFDPVFYLPDFGLTMAELPIEVKNQISHRARAAAQALAWLIDRLASQPGRP
jgi:XTP/dITP diphosphohydrolase